MIKKRLFLFVLGLAAIFAASCDLFPQDDDEAPSVSLTAPASDSAVSGTVTVAASASDDMGIFRVVFYLDGVAAHEDRDSPFTWEWDTTAAANGTHVLKAIAFDTSGNDASSAPISVSVSNVSQYSEDFADYPNGITGTGTVNMPDNASWDGLALGDASLTVVSSPVVGDAAPALQMTHGSDEGDTATYIASVSGGTKGSAEFSLRIQTGGCLNISLGSGIFGVDTLTTSIVIALQEGAAGSDAIWSDSATTTDFVTDAVSHGTNHDLRIVWDLDAGEWGAELDGTALVSSAGFLADVPSIQFLSISTLPLSAANFGGTYIIDDITAESSDSVVVPGGEVPTVNAPTGISAAVEGTGIRLSWTDASSNETGFRVYRGTTAAFDDSWQKVFESGPGVTTWLDTATVEGTKYYYLVISYIENGSDDINGFPDSYVNATVPAPVSDAPADGVYVAGSCMPAGSAHKRAVIWHDNGTDVSRIDLTDGTASDAAALDVFIGTDAVYACGTERQTASATSAYNAVRWKIDPDGTVTKTLLGSGSLNTIAKGITVLDGTVYTVGDDYNVAGIAAVLWTGTTKSYLSSSTLEYYAAGNAIVNDAGNLWIAGTYGNNVNLINNSHYWVRGSASDIVNLDQSSSVNSYGYDIATGTGGVYVGGRYYAAGVNKAAYWLDSGTSVSRYIIGPASVQSAANGIVVDGSSVYVAGYRNIEGSINAPMYWYGQGASITGETLTHPGVSALAKDIARTENVSYISGYWTTSGGDNVATYWTRSLATGRRTLSSGETNVSVERIAVKNPIPDFTEDGGDPGTDPGVGEDLPAYPDGVTAEGLVAWWPFDASVADYFGNNEGTAMGTPTYAADRFGRASSCITLDGIDDYVSVPDSAPLDLAAASFTMSGWVYLDSFTASSYPKLLFKGYYSGTWDNGYSFGINNFGEWKALSFFNNNSGYSYWYATTEALSAGTWMHVCVTFDNGANTLRFYLNGALVGTSTSVFDTLIGNSRSLYIGRANYSSGSQEYLQGKIDDLRIFSRLLSASEVTALYHEGGYAE